MDGFGRMDHRHWPLFDQSHMKDYLKDHPALKLIDVLAQRDAAISERETAMAEKKTAFAERDAALLQRDVAYADRNNAWIERDTALAALTMLRSNKDNNEAAAKYMHMVNIKVNGPFIEPLGSMMPAECSSQAADGMCGKKQLGKKTQEGGSKRKRTPKENGSQPRRRGPKSSPKAEMQAQISEDAMVVVKPEVNHHEDIARSSYADVAPYDLMLSMPIPYCSCTGGNQQCYRWGSGGWQSACCTNVLCMFPLPMSPTKRGARVPGRKMSGGAFKKILEKLAAEGFDITLPVDLKNHWAKHGTNRYVTIK